MSDTARHTLVLMRHGTAEEARSGTQGHDESRALTPGGRSQVALAAHGLRVLGIHPDIIVTSPLLRCRQTADLVGAQAACPVYEDRRLAPGMDLTDLIDVLIDHPEAHTVLACSHQPGLSLVLADLTGCGVIPFRRSQIAVAEIREMRAGGGALLAVLPPRILRAAATAGFS